MQLPGNEVGISDILQYRDCPQRFAFGMRRHVPLPERFQITPGEKDDPPEAHSYATAYGSACHDAIHFIEESGATNQEAIDHVWPTFQHWLEPGDVERMETDLDTYRTRTMLGYRLVGAEIELKAPLFVHEGTMIYFRARIDALYQHMQNSGVFLSRDYKSGRMKKSEEEIHNDIQQWAYNWVIHENYPECTDLSQIYDQLRYGETPTHKSEHQRRQIKAWIIRQVKAILGDVHLKPKQNEWCHFCPLLPDCRVTHLASDFWKNRLAAMAPEKKVGRKIVVTLTEEHTGFEVYTEMLPKVKASHKIMERFIAAVEGAMKEMPEDRRREFGYTLGNPRKIDTWGASELRQIHAMLGDDFYQIAGVTKSALERFYGDGDDTPVGQVVALARKEEGSASIKALKK